MKSILQSIVLMSAALLLASCDSGKDVRVPDPVPAPPSQAPTVSGGAAKGIVSGGSVSVHPVQGGAISTTALGSGTTGADGSFNLTVSGYNGGPVALVVTSTTGTIMTCDLPAGCGAIAYGDTVDISGDADFELTVCLPNLKFSDNVSATTANATGLTDLACGLALGTGVNPTVEQFNRTSGNVLGIIQLLTGVDLSGYKLEEIPLYDITNPGASVGALPAAAHAAASMNAAVLGLLNAADPTADTVGKALGKLKGQVTITGDGDVTMSGTNLAALSTGVSAVLTQARAALLAAGVPALTLDTAIQNAGDNAVVLALFGDNDVTVTAPPAPDIGDPVVTPKEYTKRFVDKLAQVINSIQSTTGAQGFGGTESGATETFANELEAARLLTSGPVTMAWKKLEAAVVEAEANLANGESDSDTTDDDGDGVTGTISKDDDGNVTVDGMATVTSGDLTVTVEVMGTRTEGTDTAGPGIEASEVMMKVMNGTTRVQMFSGTASATFSAIPDDFSMTSLAMTGMIWGASDTTSFGVDLSATGMSGVTSGDSSGGGVAGDYTLEIKFMHATADNLSVKAFGAIRDLNQDFIVTAPKPDGSGDNNVIYVDVTRGTSGDVDVLTDLTVALTLTLAHSQDTGAMELVSGIFTMVSSGTQTATIDDKGVVTYNDGSIQLLPAGVF